MVAKICPPDPEPEPENEYGPMCTMCHSRVSMLLDVQAVRLVHFLHEYIQYSNK